MLVRGLVTYDELRAALNGTQVLPDTSPRVFRVALLILLNRAGFNGLWRFNQSGGFNVPDGRHKRLYKRALSAADIISVGAEMYRLLIYQQDVFEGLQRVDPETCLYLDPPYYPRSATEFQGYGTGMKWDHGKQAALAGIARALVSTGVRVIASNHDLPEVRQLWQGFHFTEITSERDSINVKADGRGVRRELLIDSEAVDV